MKISIPVCLPGYAHVWDVETPNGELAHAKCKVCKQEVDFLTVAPFIPTGKWSEVDREMHDARTRFFEGLRLVVWDDNYTLRER